MTNHIHHPHPLFFIRIWTCLALALFALCGTELRAEIVINELLYHPASDNEDEEYIELYNTGPAAVSLAGWNLMGGVQYVFPPASTLEANSYVLIAKSPVALAARYPLLTAPVLGGYAGNLGNSGDTISLISATNQVIARVTYYESEPWPMEADGLGPSLELRHPGLSGDYALSWAAGADGGTPGAINAAFEPQPAPVIEMLRHDPVVPSPGDPVNVRVRADDETGLDAVDLFYRVSGDSEAVVSIRAGEDWRFLRGRSDPSLGALDWTRPTFDDGAWETGPTGIGYGDGDDATLLDDMQNAYLSVYLRKSFTIDDPALIRKLELTLDWDDGVIAYLNGVEVARRDMGTPDQFFAFDDPSTTLHEASGGGGQAETIDLTPQIPLLQTGVNILALQGHNTTLESSDFSLIPEFTAFSDPLASFTSVPMADDGLHGDASAGDGVWGATLPAKPQGAIVEFYAAARDTDAQSTLAPSAAPIANGLYQVDGAAHPDTLPLYRVVMTPADREELATRDVSSNVLLNCTFIADDKVYYAKGIRYRSRSSRIYTPKSYRIDFPASDAFGEITELNLNGHNSASQALGWDLITRYGGLYAPDYQSVHLVLNNEFTPNHLQIESIDNPYLTKHLGDDDQGNLYRGDNEATLTYRGEDPAAYADFYLKKTNVAEADYSDIITLTDTFTNATDASFPTDIGRRIDIREWLRYLAIQNVMGNREGAIYLDTGDDYYLYHRGSDDRFVLLPWDMDTVYYDAQMDVFRPSLPAIRRLMHHPQFVRHYYLALEEALNGPFTLRAMRRSLARYEGIFDAALLADVEEFVIDRRHYLLDRIPQRLSYDSAKMGSSSGDGGTLVSIAQGDSWQFLRGTAEPSGGNQDWTRDAFDDTSWESGPSGFGYGNGDDTTALDDMHGNYLSVYLRKSFEVTDPSAINNMTLTIDWDDGFIAYLNGSEIARRDMGSAGTSSAFDQPAASSHEAGTPETIDLSAFANLLQTGTNVLAIQGHNIGATSTDFSLIPIFQAGSAAIVSCSKYATRSTSLTLSGRANAAHTVAVTVNGQPATWDPFTAEWTFTSDLQPGQNLFLAQSIYETGEVGRTLVVPVERHADVRIVGGTIATDETWNPAEGPYLVQGSLEIAAGAQLSIEPDTVIFLSPGAMITVRGGIEAIGNAEAPIWFLPWTCEAWDRIEIDNADDAAIFRYCEFRESKAGGPGNTAMIGLLTIIGSDAEIDHCTFRDIIRGVEVNTGSTLLYTNNKMFNTKEAFHSNNCYASLRNSYWENQIGYADAVDFDGSTIPTSEVVNCVFNGGGDDCIDTDRTDMLIEGNIIYGFDSVDGKGVSFQGLSHPVMRNNLIFNCTNGIAIKDSCAPELDHNTFANNQRGIHSYEKNSGAGPGFGTMTNSILWGNDASLDLEDGSQLAISYSDADAAVSGIANINSNPLFVDPLSNDYHLRPGSPAISAGENQSDMGAFTASGLKVALNFDNLHITELMYNPIDGDQYEFIELHNAGDEWLNLSGLSFTAGVSFTFPVGSSLPPGGHILIVKDPAAFETKYGKALAIAGPYGGQLSNGGEKIVIKDALGNVLISLTYSDTEGWPKRADGEGSSLEPTDSLDGTSPEDWQASPSFNGSPGEATSIAVDAIVINEVLTHTDAPLEDAIELYNPTNTQVDLSGWLLSDDAQRPNKFVIAESTLLPPHGYKVFYEDELSAHSLYDPFSLSSLGESVHLLKADELGLADRFVDSVHFGSAPNGVSFGRIPTSVGDDFAALAWTTFGITDPATAEIFRTGIGSLNSPPLVGPIVINEIMYHPTDLPGSVDNLVEEFIELLNISDQTIELYDAGFGNPWHLTGAVSFNFAPGTSLAPGEYLTVVAFDPSTDLIARNTFLAAYGLDETTRLAGPWNGKLKNSNELIELLRPDEPTLEGDVPMILVDHVHYYDDVPWRAEPDGHGPSLSRVGPHAYGNDPANWLPARGKGTPGHANTWNARTGPEWVMYP